MEEKKDVNEGIQTKVSDFESKSISIDIDAYNYLDDMKYKLKEKYKRFFSFSDVIRELKGGRK